MRPGAAPGGLCLDGHAGSAKRMCFDEQVEWADKHGCLKPAMEFLKTLGPADWNYS